MCQCSLTIYMRSETEILFPTRAGMFLCPAVGKYKFSKKCDKSVLALKARGVAIVFSSHFSFAS